MKRGRPPYDDILTPRQWEVVALLREGLTNEQIAARLGISADGAKYHVAEILSKLGVSSREEAVRVLPERRRFGFLPWLPGWMRRPAPLVSASVVVVVVLTVLALFTLGLPVSDGKRTPESASEAGLDIATATLPNTVLFTKGAPANVATYGGLLRTLRQVATADELRAALVPSVQLVIIDRSALDEARSSGVLQGDVIKGRAVLGLNVTDAELREVTKFGATLPNAASAAAMRAPAAREGFYTYLFIGGPRSDLNGGYQRYFFEQIFETDLAMLDAGEIPGSQPPPLPIALLPEERISVNRGMGCTFDDRKTAAVTKREVASLHPDVNAMSLMIAYCNPGPPGQTVIGVVLPPPTSLVRVTVPTAELMP